MMVYVLELPCILSGTVYPFISLFPLFVCVEMMEVQSAITLIVVQWNV